MLVQAGSYAVTTLMQYVRLCHFDQFAGIVGVLANSIWTKFGPENKGLAALSRGICHAKPNRFFNSLRAQRSSSSNRFSGGFDS